MKKVIIFIADSNGAYPVPAAKGGSVATLVEQLVSDNQKNKQVNLTVVSFYDSEAVKMSKKYSNTTFIWITTPKILKILDSYVFRIIPLLSSKIKSVSYRSILGLMHYIYISSKILKKDSYDSVVLENNIPISWIIKLSRYKGDFYYHIHNIPRINAMLKNVFKKCSGYLCVSNYVGQQLQLSSCSIGPIAHSRINTLYNCIDTSFFIPNQMNRFDIEQLRKKYNLDETDRVLLFVGRLSSEKGFDKVIEAIKYIQEERVKLLIVGSLLNGSDQDDKYIEKIKELPQTVRNKVVFTGYTDRKKLPQLYNLSDIAILPSMWDEPAGLVMIEAMACETCVITTDSGGIAEYVGDCAVLIERNENLVNNLAVEIDRLLTDNKRRLDLAKRGRERICSLFSTEFYLGRFLQVVNQKNSGR
jgi:glycosyltransferase involved in cell wall biosynthesis